MPVECTIDMPGIGKHAAPKSMDLWTAEKVPPGLYEAAFTALGKTLSVTVDVKPDTLTYLMLNFVDLTVESKFEPHAYDVPNPVEGVRLGWAGNSGGAFLKWGSFDLRFLAARRNWISDKSCARLRPRISSNRNGLRSNS